jgi:hypothetical protein
MSNVKTIDLATRSVKIAPFSFKQLDDHQADINLLMQNFTLGESAHRDALVRVITVAATRAGDPVTEDEVRDGLDLSNAHDALLAFFSRNGFVPKDGAQSGEATAAPSAS